MSIGRKIGLATLLALLVLATPSLAQLDSTKSWFLFTGQVTGNLTLVSLLGEPHNVPLPEYSTEIQVQTLTDIANRRFLVLSGLKKSDGSVLHTFSNVSYSQFTATTVNTFTLPLSMNLVDVTYDLTIQQPVSLVVNGTSCGLMVGYGPVADEPLSLMPLKNCEGITTIGSMLKAKLVGTVSVEDVEGTKATKICQGDPSLPLRCERHFNVIVSNLIGSTTQLSIFPLAYTRNATNQLTSIAGAYNALATFIPYGTLSAGDTTANAHIPIYWDPLYSVVAGAWKTLKNEIQVFAGTPYGGWFSPMPFVLPKGDLIGFALAYKPVTSPTYRPHSSPRPPFTVPSSRTGLIVGLAIGGVAATALVVLIIVFVRRSIAFQPRSEYRKLAPN